MKREGEIFLTDQVQQVRAAVIGDMMADRYVFGSVNRISPEAPVPVNLVQTERAVLGGARPIRRPIWRLWGAMCMRQACAGKMKTAGCFMICSRKRRSTTAALLFGTDIARSRRCAFSARGSR